MMMSHANNPVQRYYRHQARIYDLTRWAVLRGRRRAVTRLDVRPDDALLEVGCGTGLNFPRLLARLDPARGSITGLDFSAPMLARARKRVDRYGWNNVTLVQGDAANMERDRAFDRILFAYSLSMIPDWHAALRRAHDHLADGGRLVVLDFGRFSAWGPAGTAIRAWLRFNHVHVNRPWPDLLRRQFRHVEVHTHLGGYYLTVTAEK